MVAYGIWSLKCRFTFAHSPSVAVSFEQGLRLIFSEWPFTAFSSENYIEEIELNWTELIFRNFLKKQCFTNNAIRLLFFATAIAQYDEHSTSVPVPVAKIRRAHVCGYRPTYM